MFCPLSHLISSSMLSNKARFFSLSTHASLSQCWPVSGVLIGFDNLDGVIRIIREASSNSAAAAGLRNAFSLFEKQAEALLDISLRRLSLRESGNFMAERKSLMEQISKLEELLSSRKNILEAQGHSTKCRNQKLMADMDSGEPDETVGSKRAQVVSSPWRFTVGNWLCNSDLASPTGIERVLTEKDLLADSYSDLEASILDEKEFLLLKVISTFPELSCLMSSIIGAGRGSDGVAFSMTHFSGRVTSSHFIILFKETLAFVISVINKVVSPFCGCNRTLEAQVFMTLEYCSNIYYTNQSKILLVLYKLIEQEAIEMKNKFSNPRPSMLEDTDDGQLEDIDVIPNEEMILALSEKGYVKRMKPNTFNLQNRGTIGKSVGKLKVNDSMSDFLVFRAHYHVLYFSDKGTVYSARAYKIPECSRTAAGTPLVQILSLSDGERITSIIPVSEFAEDQFLLMLTMQGYIKRVSLNLFSSIRSIGIIAIQLVHGDELKWVRLCSNDDFVAMASHNGMIRTLGRNTRGALAMRLKKGDKMASVDIIPSAMWNNLETSSKFPGSNAKNQNGPWLLFVSENGYGKRVPLCSFRISSLNRVGLIGYKFSAEDRLAAVFVVGFSSADIFNGESDEQVVLISQSGTVNRIKVRDISIQSRFAREVILMRLDHSGKIQSASLISATDCEPEEVLTIAQGYSIIGKEALVKRKIVGVNDNLLCPMCGLVLESSAHGAKRQAILDGCVVGFCVVDLVALWVGVRAFSNPTMYNGHTSVALERVQKILYNKITIRCVMYNGIVILSYLFFTSH
ncbi:DNA gyrase subunit A, chloroplastic/mitochondrial [Glycine max]|nr:DNA gyrase subunit A, chloroplastic/mitochondrial [Glycine max]